MLAEVFLWTQPARRQQGTGMKFLAGLYRNTYTLI
jgi:hypothetical protein